MTSRPTPMSANEFIEQQLDERAMDLEKILKADVVAFIGDLVVGVDNLFRYVVEGKRQSPSQYKKLVVILTTIGGYIEIVHRIVDTLRYHYKLVDFIVPDYAYSAGTVFVMLGDAIHMDYYSRLGPIDPQVEREEGRMVPALGYLRQWERLLEKAQNGTITIPEVQLMIEGFDQAELFQYEQQRELSISLLKEWLVKYKFKNWKHTATRKLKVTKKMREKRASEIATALSNPERWHVHGYGISMEILQRELKLLIDDFGANQQLSEQMKRYYSLLHDYMTKLGQRGVLHTAGTFQPFMMGV